MKCQHKAGKHLVQGGKATVYNKVWYIVSGINEMSAPGPGCQGNNIQRGRFDKLFNAKCFSCLDVASGFHQNLLRDEDKPKTAFRIPFGHYQFRV